MTLEDIKHFRKVGWPTAGHPERKYSPGIEATTGPLGQGISMAVGLALAERMLAARFNRDGHEIVDHYTFMIASDGDIQEGISSEASSLAGHLGLGRLIVFYDNNHIQLASPTSEIFSEDVASATTPTAGTCRTSARTCRWSGSRRRRARRWRSRTGRRWSSSAPTSATAARTSRTPRPPTARRSARTRCG